MLIDYENITEENPLVFKSADEFLEGVKAFLMKSVGMQPSAATAQITQTEMCTRTVKRVLKDKGYAVGNYKVFQQIVAGIPTTKRGRDLWYNTAAIMQIPDKK